MTTAEPISDSVERIFDSNSCPSNNDSDALSRKLNKAIDEVIASVVSGVAEELKPATQETDQLSSSDQQEGELLKKSASIRTKNLQLSMRLNKRTLIIE